MSNENETTHRGASGFEADPAQHKAFPGERNELDKALDNGGEGEDNEDKPLSDREKLLDDMEARIQASREVEAGVSEAPAGESQEEGGEELEGSGEEGEGQEGHEVAEGGGEEKSELPEEYRDDPLAEYIVMDEANNTPMFVTKVNGEEKYIPLDRARQQLQKHLAAEASLQQSAETKKQLDAREVQILASEQALEAKSKLREESPPSTPPAPDVSDQDLGNEAQGVVESLFRGTENEAVEKLTTLLKQVRGQPQPAVEQISTEEVVSRTTQAVREGIAEDDATRDATDGLKKFTEDYPNIAADEALFNYADVLTDQIAQEWKDEGKPFKTSELMMEAGKRTTEWVQSMKTPDKGGPKPKNDRHERKRSLRPMPTGQSNRATSVKEEPEQTPQDAVAEMRASRGQA